MHVAGDDGEEEQQAVQRRVRSQTRQHHDGQRREEDVDEHHQDAVGEVSHCVEHGWARYVRCGVCVQSLSDFLFSKLFPKSLVPFPMMLSSLITLILLWLFPF